MASGALVVSMLLTTGAVTADSLRELVEARDASGAVQRLNGMGGPEGIAQKLGSNGKDGISDDAASRNKETYGANELPTKPTKTFMQYRLFFATLKDTTLIILMVAAVANVAMGMSTESVQTGWIDGTAILVAVLVVATVTAANDYSKERQFQELNKVVEARKGTLPVSVMRGGRQVQIDMKEVVVGDVVVIATGESLPADGLLLEAADMRVDESSMTGESETAVKSVKDDPYLLANTKVMQGTGRMIVIAVGTQAQWGRLKAMLDEPSDETPLQTKLAQLAERIGAVGVAAAALTFGLLFSLWLARNYLLDAREWKWGQLIEVNRFFLAGVSLIVIAVPEGLPLAVTMSLAYSMRKMMKDNCLVRRLEACETMGGATQICSDKTGTLTENRMTVVRMLIGGETVDLANAGETPELKEAFRGVFAEAVAANSTATIQAKNDKKDEASEGDEKKEKEEKASKGNSNQKILWEHKNLKKEKEETASKEQDENNNEEKKDARDEREVVGSKTEGAMLLLLERYKIDYEVVRGKVKLVERFPFSSDSKRMGSIVRSAADTRFYCTGAAEIVAKFCTKILTLDGQEKAIDQKQVEGAQKQFAKDGLRVVAIAVRSDSGKLSMAESGKEEKKDSKKDLIDSKEKEGKDSKESKKEETEKVEGSKDRKDKKDIKEASKANSHEHELTLVALVGIKDPVRRDVPDAVRRCQKAGVTVRMLTGDNALTATHIAAECGIVKANAGNEEVMEGSVFRALSEAQVSEALPRLRVLARASPADKHRLVRALRATGEVVAVTGDGTNDAPQLKEADVGFSMGMTGTDVAKEASDIVLLDDNFASIVNAIKWGRNVYDSIRKFIQFQLTVTAVAVVLSVVGSVLWDKPPLSPIQMLWVNLIMDTFASLALATEAPTEKLLDRAPYGRTEPIITRKMWRFIVGSSMLQLAIVFFLLYSVQLIPWFGLPTSTSDWDERHFRVRGTVVFNTFVFLQLFNLFHARKLEDELNIFTGLLSNWVFWAVFAFGACVQAIIVQFGQGPASTTSLSVWQWLTCIGIGSLSLLWGFVLRFIPIHNVVRSKDEENCDRDEEAAPLLRQKSGREPSEHTLEVRKHAKEAWHRLEQRLSIIVMMRRKRN